MSTSIDFARLLMIDGIGPFFRYSDRKRINWSKIPFSDLETEAGLRPEVLDQVPTDFSRFASTVRGLGYNAITLDDVAHLVVDDCYSQQLQHKIESYRTLYRRLFEIAETESLRVFITMDIMFFNDALRRRFGSDRSATLDWLTQQLDKLFREFSPIAGIIMRFGENDGVDVKGDFRSELWLRKPKEVRQFVQKLLPVFEQHKRSLIFRTWCVGAYQIGDLNWNTKRFHEVFGDLDSPSLVISCKYGESDFYRYLPLNQLFLESSHQKMIEFQARREYEGFGAYPSFVGWDAECYLRQLSAAENVIGMSVWCQTGGWGKRRQLTYLRNSSFWVELNVFALARLWQGRSCEQAIEEFRSARISHVPPAILQDFLRRSDIVIKDLLYVRELAERQLYFRRLRLPPQLFVFWDRILIDPTVRRALRCLVRDKDAAIEQANNAFDELQKMIALARDHRIPSKGLKLQSGTFEILVAARQYFFGSEEENAKQALVDLKSAYQKRFKRHYAVILHFDRSGTHQIPLHWLLPLVVREKSRYRLLDQVLTIRLLGLLYPVANRLRHRLGPKFARKQAMGLDALLK